MAEDGSLRQLIGGSVRTTLLGSSFVLDVALFRGYLRQWAKLRMFPEGARFPALPKGHVEGEGKGRGGSVAAWTLSCLLSFLQGDRDET